MILTVTRDFIPIARTSSWEQQAYRAVVWQHDGQAAHVLTSPLPPEYALGLLRCEIDGVAVTLQDFDVALSTLGLTRVEIWRSILVRT